MGLGFEAREALRHELDALIAALRLFVSATDATEDRPPTREAGPRLSETPRSRRG
jgi:hypothetical protein